MKISLDWHLSPHFQSIMKQLKILQKNLRPLVTDEIKDIWKKTQQAPKNEQIEVFKNSAEVLLRKIEKEFIMAAKPIRKVIQLSPQKAKNTRPKKISKKKVKKKPPQERNFRAEITNLNSLTSF